MTASTAHDRVGGRGGARDASSPVGFTMPWYASGASSTGIETSVPSTVVAVETFAHVDEHTRPQLPSPKAATFSRSVHSSPAPPAK